VAIAPPDGQATRDARPGALASSRAFAGVAGRGRRSRRLPAQIQSANENANRDDEHRTLAKERARTAGYGNGAMATKYQGVRFIRQFSAGDIDARRGREDVYM